MHKRKHTLLLYVATELERDLILPYRSYFVQTIFIMFLSIAPSEGNKKLINTKTKTSKASISQSKTNTVAKECRKFA